jgi:hypothetical protein
LSSLTAIFGNSAEKEQDSEKLMDLYWSRAELKKEFAGMRKEQFRLKDKVKKQEGKTARVQQQLVHLEGLLADPQWAHNVVVHFQLRGLSGRCQSKLAKFAEQLKQQREEKQHQSILDDWNNSLAAEVSQAQQQIMDKQEETHQLEDRLQAERRRLSSMSAISRFFRGRSITRTLDELVEQVETAQREEQMLEQEVDAIRNRQSPDTQGLNIPTKRSINLMIMAFTQQMYMHFDNEDLAELIREAGEKSVGAVNYGDNGDCLQLLKRMQSCAEKMEQDAEFANILQQRAKLIGEKARYQQDTDAVPVATSVAMLFKIDKNAVVRESELDILGSNLWGISQVLSR